MPELEEQLPPNLKVSIAYDATRFIQASIDEVVKTLGEAVLIVIVVVFLFLGAFRSVLIPVVTIPLSMIGVLFFMQAMGYSINLLTLLAMVLAIGLVVDDAIVVVENIHRHIEEGKPPFEAALEGAREIAVPVVSMTITLAAVYAPIGFHRPHRRPVQGIRLHPGRRGDHFRDRRPDPVADDVLAPVAPRGESLGPGASPRPDLRGPEATLPARPPRHPGHPSGGPGVRRAGTGADPGTADVHQKELAPEEDQGIVFLMTNSPQTANLDYLNRYTAEFEGIFRSFPEYYSAFQING